MQASPCCMLVISHMEAVSCLWTSFLSCSEPLPLLCHLGGKGSTATKCKRLGCAVELQGGIAQFSVVFSVSYLITLKVSAGFGITEGLSRHFHSIFSTTEMYFIHTLWLCVFSQGCFHLCLWLSVYWPWTYSAILSPNHSELWDLPLAFHRQIQIWLS